MKEQFNPTYWKTKKMVKGVSKGDVFKKVMELEKEGWEIVHPMKSFLDGFDQLIYYITMRTEKENKNDTKR